MNNIYNIALLPNQHAINSVAALFHDFAADNADFKNLLAKLKKTISESGFMENQDHKDWFYKRGVDYSSNPKLFAHAPLNYTCAFLSEIFKRYDIEYISEALSTTAVKRALLRLDVLNLVQ